MNELDKLFKNKLEDREFEFKDSYWEAAEQLLEQQDKRRRRGGFWWWSMGAMVLLLTVAAYFLFNTNTNTNTSEQGLIQNENRNEVKSEDLITLEPENKKDYESEDSNESSNLKNTASTLKDLSTDINTNSKQPSNETQVPSEYNGAGGQKNDPVNINQLPEIPKSINTPSLLIDSILLQQQEQESTIKTGKEIVGNKEEVEILPLKKEEDLVIENDSPVEELAFLETIPSFIDIPESECDDCFELKELNKLPKYKRLQFGLIAESIFYPKGNNDKAGFGGATGLFAEYQLDKNFSLRTGLQYAIVEAKSTKFLSANNLNADAERYTLSDFDIYDFSIENQYSFGLTTIETIRPPKFYHFLEIPLVAQYKLKNHTFEAGTQIGILVGIRGKQLTQTSQFPWEVNPTSNSPIQEDSQNVWISKEDYSKFLPQITAGYSYAFNEQLSAGLNAFYRVDNFNSSSSDDLFLEINPGSSEELSLQNFSNRISLRLGLRWNFKN